MFRHAMMLSLFAGSAALAQTEQKAPEAVGPPATFGPRDVFALSQASDVQISPDGKHIAYTRATGDIMIDGDRKEVWLIDVATGRQSPLGVAGSSRPRWSPDGTRLAFAARMDGQRPQIYVRWLGAGTNAAITAVPEAPADMAWSPDGKKIGFTMFVPGDGAKLGTTITKPEGAKWAEPIKIIGQVRYREDGAGYLRPGYNHVFAISADGGAARQLTFGPYDDGGSVAWTANGRSLLVSANRGKDADRDPENTDLFAVDAESGALRQLTTRYGPDEQPVASPDGRLIAFVGYDDKLLGYQNKRLSVMNPDGTNVRVLTTIDRSVGDPQWSGDGKSIFVSYADHGTTKVARITLDGRLTVAATGLASGELDRPYSSGDFSVSKNDTVAVTAGDTTHPGDVAIAGRGGLLRRLTNLNQDLFAGKTLGNVKAMTVASTAGGLPIDAWMVTPPNFDPTRKYPLILEIHGGPFASYGPVWSTDDQLYAAAGYVVVYANPRGSTSYGEEFANRIHHNYPSDDYDDLMSVVDAAIASGSVDPDALFVTGGSGGGLLTAWIVGKTDRFKAAVSQKPVINWTSEVLTTDGYTTMAKYWFGKMPWEDQAQFWRRSPLSLVGNVKTPTAVMVGEEDHRTPPGEAEQFYAALQIRSVPTALIRVPSASHGGLADRPSQLVAENAAILAWFAKYRSR
jgi:dipeptidyl aminopeptidase/acylaminoacyl peptidase